LSPLYPGTRNIKPFTGRILPGHLTIENVKLKNLQVSAGFYGIILDPRGIVF
jgi:hypothetical protein